MSFLNREKCLQSLIILSKKGFWKAEEAIKFYTRLLMLQDKNLRELINKHIIYLIKKHDFQGRNSSIHRNLVNFFMQVINEGEDDLVKRVIRILISLYNKRIWKDTKTINVIGGACMGTYSKAVKLAGLFFIETTEKVEEELDSSESEISEDDYESNLYKVSFTFLFIIFGVNLIFPGQNHEKNQSESQTTRKGQEKAQKKDQKKRTALGNQLFFPDRSDVQCLDFH